MIRKLMCSPTRSYFTSRLFIDICEGWEIKNATTNFDKILEKILESFEKYKKRSETIRQSYPTRPFLK